MTAKRLAGALAVFALAGAPSAFAADEEKKSDKPAAVQPNAAKDDHSRRRPASQQGSEKPKSDAAPMSRSPAPASGSMPKGAAPKGKLGTEPTARGRLGTDPKPGESSKPPPRLN